MEQRPLHWSERAKMYPTPTGSGHGPGPQAPRPGRETRSRREPSDKRPSRRGLWISLIILLLLAGAAAAIYWWYLPSRDSDNVEAGLEARSLVRQAMTAIDQAYAQAGTYDPQTVDPATLSAITPAITYHPASSTAAATAPTSSASENTVDYAGTATNYAVGTVSADGTAYGVVVENRGMLTTAYYIDGQPVDSWSTPSDVQTTSTVESGEDIGKTTTTTESITGPVDSADDVQAMTLVRSSIATVEAAYSSVGTFEPSQLTASLLQQMEPSTSFIIRDSAQAATAPVSSAVKRSMDYSGTTTTYYLGTNSNSGTSFGVMVSKDATGRTTTYYVNGQVEDWSTRLLAPTVG